MDPTKVKELKVVSTGPNIIYKLKKFMALKLNRLDIKNHWIGKLSDTKASLLANMSLAFKSQLVMECLKVLK